MRLTAVCAAALAVLAGPAMAQSRYSVADASLAQTRPLPSTARAAGLRFLTWPGKVTPQAAAPAARAPPMWARPQAAWTPAPRQPRPEPIPAPAPPAAAALPTSIYAPPPPRIAAAPLPPAPAPSRPAALAATAPQDGYQTPHFYSLHRAYGQAPDPVPLPQQFFADSPTDLAAPPPPVARPVTTASGRVVRAQPSSTEDGAS